MPDTVTPGVKLESRLARRANIALATAVSSYRQHTGSLPAALTDLLVPVTNASNAVAGPFIATVPTAPTGWTAYRYERRPDGSFTITTAGEGRTVSVPDPR